MPWTIDWDCLSALLGEWAGEDISPIVPSVVEDESPAATATATSLNESTSPIQPNDKDLLENTKTQIPNTVEESHEEERPHKHDNALDALNKGTQVEDEELNNQAEVEPKVQDAPLLFDPKDLQIPLLDDLFNSDFDPGADFWSTINFVESISALTPQGSHSGTSFECAPTSNPIPSAVAVSNASSNAPLDETAESSGQELETHATARVSSMPAYDNCNIESTPPFLFNNTMYQPGYFGHFGSNLDSNFDYNFGYNYNSAYVGTGTPSLPNPGSLPPVVGHRKISPLPARALQGPTASPHHNRTSTLPAIPTPSTSISPPVCDTTPVSPAPIAPHVLKRALPTPSDSDQPATVKVKRTRNTRFPRTVIAQPGLEYACQWPVDGRICGTNLVVRPKRNGWNPHRIEWQRHLEKHIATDGQKLTRYACQWTHPKNPEVTCSSQGAIGRFARHVLDEHFGCSDITCENCGVTYTGGKKRMADHYSKCTIMKTKEEDERTNVTSVEQTK